MKNPIKNISPLNFPWKTPDPFLFCAYHNDAYPKGNESMGPAASLSGRNIGSDFAGIDGWRMYHGHQIPGFPKHPHRGFETVTITRKGLIDHSDSLGATARFGRGDLQWLTAGGGIQHSEMFPMVNIDRDNHLELFQIWLNLPKKNKLATPHFVMHWADQVPTVEIKDSKGNRTRVTLHAGALGETVPPNPPPHSWASQADSQVAIWTIRLDANAVWTLPPVAEGVNRSLYLFSGSGIQLADQKIPNMSCIELSAAPTLTSGEQGAFKEDSLQIVNGPEESELLLLQGRPIGEPVAQYGPFVMNTSEEIQQAFQDYRRTEFGGWGWKDDAPVHSRAEGRFARHADGRLDRPVEKH